MELLTTELSCTFLRSRATAWNKLRARASGLARDDPGCDQMRRFQREDVELQKMERSCRGLWRKKKHLYGKYYILHVGAWIVRAAWSSQMTASFTSSVTSNARWGWE